MPDSRGPCLEQRPGVVDRADAARSLNARGRGDRGQPGDQLALEPPRPGAGEVDDVDEARTRRDEAPNERGGVGQPVRDVLEVAAFQPDRLAPEHVDGRDHVPVSPC